jgi:hypothetical protein
MSLPGPSSRSRHAIKDSERYWAEIARKTEDDIRREHL